MFKVINQGCSPAEDGKSAAIIFLWRPFVSKSELHGPDKANSGVPFFRSPRLKLSIPTSSHNVKYKKLKRLFSGKYHSSSSSTPTPSASGSSTGKSQMTAHSFCRRKIIDLGEEEGSFMSIVDMDPPLPVTTREGTKGDNLWNRRCGGTAKPLKRLEVQRLELCRQAQQPITV